MAIPHCARFDQLDGACGQTLERGFVPRLSGGTLQLSMRCSSVHLRPSRSLPVSVRCCTASAAGAPFCANVGAIKVSATRQPNALLHLPFMASPRSFKRNAIDLTSLMICETLSFHPKPDMVLPVALVVGSCIEAAMLDPDLQGTLHLVRRSDIEGDER
ncbi:MULTISPECIES: hypothetical protein [Bradyrhizobium]|uniref:hypothetical protein n=1 Tax=Bradyrhizobium TaxID=374 RepID=UPI0012FD2E05|nr:MULTISPECIES: hypothetical protein [Bradyrhizobium]